MNLWNVRAVFYDVLRQLWPWNRILEVETRNLKQLINQLPRKPEQIVDIGCGTGIALNLVGENCRIAGIDQSRTMAKIAYKKSMPVAIGVAESLPFKKARIDFFLAIGIAEYISDLESLLQEIASLAAPDSYLLLTSSPKNWFTIVRGITAVRIIGRTAQQVIDAAAQYGFLLIEKKSCISQDAFMFIKNQN
jgi:predicted TPR repeat methyltransferase